MANDQLRLIDTAGTDDSRRSWRLDRRTRELGLRGVADARAALRRVGPDPGAVPEAPSEDRAGRAAAPRRGRARRAA